VLVSTHDLDRGAAQIHGARYYRRLVIADVVGVTVAELAKIVEPPATHSPARHHCARVAEAECDLHGMPPEVDGANGSGGFVVSDDRRLADTELPALVRAPADYSPVLAERTAEEQ
jgi:hypothetical protein